MNPQEVTGMMTRRVLSHFLALTVASTALVIALPLGAVAQDVVEPEETEEAEAQEEEEAEEEEDPFRTSRSSWRAPRSHSAFSTSTPRKAASISLSPRIAWARTS